MNFRLLSLIIIFAIYSSCTKETEGEPMKNASTYFPPLDGSAWENISPSELDWNTANLTEFLNFLESGNTRAFIVLKDGKIAMEHYFNETLTNQPFTQQSNWYWASAGKTLKSSLLGIAASKNHLTLEDKSSDYLGSGWSSLTPNEEDLIKIKHHISMSTGLDEGVSNPDCSDPECFIYKAPPGTRWSYHNGPYTITEDIIANAVNSTFNNYFSTKIKDPIGMDGSWIQSGDNNVYFSTARSMARFGLLILNKGLWELEQIIPSAFCEEMVTPSQEMNPSYGYLWWLNGQTPSMLPGSQIKFNTELAPNAPAEMYAAMGKNGQLINIVPSQNLVVIRMGNNPNNGLVPVTWQNEMWEQLSAIIN